jgi:hypothetical protein
MGSTRAVPLLTGPADASAPAGTDTPRLPPRPQAPTITALSQARLPAAQIERREPLPRSLWVLVTATSFGL